MPRRRSFMKRDIKLYNLIFPMWGIYFYAILFPYFFVLLLPVNFIVDTVMLLLLFFLFKVPEKKELTGRAFGKHGALDFWRIFWRQEFWSSSAVRFHCHFIYMRRFPLWERFYLQRLA